MRLWLALALTAGCASAPRPLQVPAHASPAQVAERLKDAHYCRHPSSYQGRDIFVECSHQAHSTNWALPIATRNGESMVFVAYGGERMARVQRVYVYGSLPLAQSRYDRLASALRQAYGPPSEQAASAHGPPLDGTTDWLAWFSPSDGTLHSLFILEDHRVIEEILSPLTP